MNSLPNETFQNLMLVIVDNNISESGKAIIRKTLPHFNERSELLERVLDLRLTVDEAQSFLKSLTFRLRVINEKVISDNRLGVF